MSGVDGMSFEWSTNEALELAEGYVEETGHHVFLTGKAGTGKTTFLKKLQETSSKRMITTAPTGVAALNAGGVTLHSFFQLPFGPFVPGSEAFERDQQRRFRISREKKNIIQSLDLLVIDEISMVRADLLDAVDAALRRHRRSDKPFGGVQLLMIGDLHQLSPVARSHEWELLQGCYNSVYFFDSHALSRTRFISIELEHIYRQSDDSFIRILNQVRDNRLEPESIQALNTRYDPDFVPDTEQGYITLTSHNKKAENINKCRLEELPGQEYLFSAKISGDFPEQIYPTAASLVLKKGAQVMFVRNDPGPEKLYYNGKIGRITSISRDEIQVLCPGEPEPVKVEPLTWENIKYTINEDTREIQEEVAGSFTQHPLKPAWAITIHKSQGLTFERAIIDVQNVFTHGQVYVALSRCKTMEGMVLGSPLAARGVGMDEAILGFDREIRQNPPGKEHLDQARVAYQQQLLLECFDMGRLESRLQYLLSLFKDNSRLVRITGGCDIKELEGLAGEVIEVSRVFLRELGGIFSPERLPESDSYIQERVRKGSRWFQGRLENLAGPLGDTGVETDNAEVKKRIVNALNNLQKDLAVKLAGIKSCEQGFSSAGYLQAVARAEVEFTPRSRKKPEASEWTESDIAHPELFQALKKWRQAKAREQNLAPYQILHQRVAVQIAVTLPATRAELKKIRGVGEKTIARFGQELLDMVADYRRKHGIEKVVLPEKPGSQSKEQPSKKIQAGDTRQVTLDLFRQGQSPDSIAENRGLTRSTIDTHLAYLIHQQELRIDELLSFELQKSIEQAISEVQGNSLKDIKEKLGDEVNYGQIKMVLAHQGTFIR
ncbi:helix-turn-helix domain-containing protein [Desulfonatronospira sp. MSAO_Bac3]|uniref:helix-turn-helix domain-containing protein n=1 Tax=Desulfonatronospira sp. MSAO_Bac3 TaxID=2293857 RepID=UPI000FEE9A79|nr:helix-turn-helix domain-containing protein [Desulfonatronospira sp. MSAO_Bac3]RQD79245.1 MAG: helicase [Desulfonatronospira sp. MSAO_Bac3]